MSFEISRTGACVASVAPACLLVLMGLSIVACKERNGNVEADGITIQHEVLLKTVARPYALTQMSDGGFVIAGDLATAWAVGTDSAGDLRWEFKQDREEDGSGPGSQGEFRGAVALSDGNVLLCGHQIAHGSLQALLVKIGPRGEVLERRFFIPNENGRLISAIAERCLKWGHEIAVIGRANEPSLKRVGWLMVLDDTGREMRQVLLADEIGGTQAMEGPDGTLYAARVGGTQMTLARIDPAGNALATRSLRCLGFNLLKSPTPPSGIRLIEYLDRGKARLLTLDDQLQDRRESIPIDSVGIDDGAGFELPDGGLLLFGSIPLAQVKSIGIAGQFTNPYAAAIARVRPTGMAYKPHLMDRSGHAYTVSDAIRIGPNRFVAVHLVAAPLADQTGIVISWIDVN